MRIGLFTDTFVPQTNGVATSVKILKDELEALGHEVYLVTINDKRIRYEMDDKLIKIPSIKILKGYDHRLARLLPLNVRYRIKRWNLDVIHTHTEFSVGLVGFYSARRFKIPLVHTYHTMYEDYLHYITRGIAPEYPVKKVLKTFTRILLKNCTEIIVPTHKTEVVLSDYGLESLNTVPTGIDVKTFYRENYGLRTNNKVMRELGLNKNDFHVLFVGRLAKEKNIDFVIRAMKNVVPKYKNIKLVIIGEGPYLSKLETEAEEIKDNVIFAGKKPWSIIGEYYQLGDIFVTASTSETQGLTVLEALSASLPVLCYDDESFKEFMVDGKNGFLFTEENQLAEQIIELYNKKELYDEIVENTRDTVKDVTSEAFATSIVKVYEKAIEKYERG